MIVRFIGISVVKWLVSFLVVYLAMSYLIPASIIGLGRIVLVWVLTTLSAFVFAEWAFKPKLPERQDIIQLMIVSTVVNVLLSIGTDIIVYGKPTLLIGSFDIQVQYLLELLVIPLAGYIARKRRLQAAASEGLVS